MKKLLTAGIVLSSLLVSSCSEKEPEQLVPYEINERRNIFIILFL